MRKSLHRVGLVMGAAGAWLAASAPVLACPICFRFEESATTDGVVAAVVVLVGVTTAVLSVCAGFVVRFARREARTASEPDARASRVQTPDASRFQIQDSRDTI